MNLSPYEKWTPAHIHFLMDGKPPESRFLDYKESLPSDEVELLKDVSAFANTQGGVIVYGIREDNTVPTEIAPLSVIDEDKTLSQLSNWIRANLDPNLSEFYFDLIEVKSGKVVVLRIPQSPNAPHMIAKGSAKFYSRGAAGNTPMDSFEIRSAFLASESLVEKVNAFREHRAVTIGDNALPFNLIERSIAVLHIIPLSAFQRPHNFSIAELRKALGDTRPPGSTLGHNRDVCLEGALNVASESAKGDAISYALLFRTGVFEAVYPWGYTLPQTGKRYIKEYPVLRSFYDEFSAYLGALSLLGMTPPLLLCMSYLNTAGMPLYHPPQFEAGTGRTLKMDTLHLPAIESNTMSVDPDEFLKRMSDTLANAFGLEFSRLFRDGKLLNL